MDAELTSLLGDANKHSNSLKEKLTSTLMGYLQKYAVYDLPKSDNHISTEQSISQLKTTCDSLGANILKSVGRR
jgi:hypothetical protein